MAELTREERNREKQEFWSNHIKAWEKSSLSQIEYCKENSLSRHRFTYWKSKQTKKSEGITFMPVFNGPMPRLQKTTHDFAPLKLILREKYRIEIGDGFSSTTLQKLIYSIEGLQS